MRYFRHLAWLWFVLGSGSFLAASDPIEELRARVEALEQQNRYLREAVGTATQHLAVPGDWPPLPPGNAEPPLEGHHTWTPTPEPRDSHPLGMTASWHNGLELITRDRAFRVHVGGRTQFDAAWFSAAEAVQQNINIPYGNGVDFRRARLRVDGTMYDTIEWAVEYDFVNAVRAGNVTNDGFNDFDVTALTDMWWTFKEVPLLGNVRIGNQKEPIGFEHVVSSRFLPFMERSYNQDTFYGGFFNGFTPGISAFNNYADQRGLWHLGVYKPTDNVFAYNTKSGDYSATGRITYLPWYECEGLELLHLGFSVRASSSVNDRIRYRTRDAIRSGVASTWPVPADTGTFFADHQQFLNTELVAVHGPWTFQSEYLVAFVQDARTTVNGPAMGSLVYDGGYIQTLYFLTGESDHYNRQTGALERVTPHLNTSGPASQPRGWGAWQVGARYNYLDLNSQGINGGILHNLAVTLNWFLNPNMKIQFNYSATDRDVVPPRAAGNGWIHGWGTRLAHDF